jgi:glycosyltransferase involved in cell wall biosynthesis
VRTGDVVVTFDPVIDVVLPVLDEASAIPRVLASLPTEYRPIVVDNGSSDGSAAIASDYGALVVHEPTRGFGSACYAGLLAATHDVVCFMDCDGSLDGAHLPRVSAPIEAGTADLVLGARVADRGAWPTHARIGNRVVARRVRRKTGIVLRDLGPMRSARRVALLELGLTDRRFGWPLEMVMRAAARDWRIAEVDVPYRPRLGSSKVTGTVLGTARTVRDMTAVLR